MNNQRRQILWMVPASLLAAGTTQALAADAAKVDENDAAAKGLGYKHDATKVDAAKYPSYAKGKVCSGCALYQGKAGDAWGACGIFGGKQVAAAGWCSAWNKKQG
jgi:hypothetical protein